MRSYFQNFQNTNGWPLFFSPADAGSGMQASRSRSLLTWGLLLGLPFSLGQAVVGTVTRLAGNVLAGSGVPNNYGNADGVATAATMYYPFGVALNANGSSLIIVRAVPLWAVVKAGVARPMRQSDIARERY